MDSAKIRLSPEEAALVNEGSWILTKNRIIEKVKLLLVSVQEKQSELLAGANKLPIEVLQTTPKVSRGENYEGLPYLILDHPRLFDKEDMFAIRTMFWWGHFFSTTIHLSGKYKTAFASGIVSGMDELSSHDVYICRNEDPWQHHFGEDNYISISRLDREEMKRICEAGTFIKLSKKISLKEWNEAEGKLLEDFGLFIRLLQA